MQVLNAFSRMGASVLTWVPPPRTGHFSDQALLTRLVQRPQSSLDALGRGAIELSTGIITGVAGIVVDPIQVRASNPEGDDKRGRGAEMCCVVDGNAITLVVVTDKF